jgi:hypothetical protein
MPIQGQIQGKKPIERKEDETPEIVRKNSAILENLNLMYETIHKETEILKKLKDDPPIFEKKQEEPTKQDISAGVLIQQTKKTNKSTLQQNSVLRSSSTGAPTDLKSPGVSKSMIPLFKKKPHLPAPALLPRWK